MTYRHVALMGRAGAGKDVTAARLVSAHQFTRVAFADPLKRAAMALDPIVDHQPIGCASVPVRLSEVVHRRGWDAAKTLPEVRGTLQRLGQSVRDQDPGVWLRLALALVDSADRWNLPVVVSDCRYPNEAAALRERGFLLVRVERPGATAGGEAARHVSETGLDSFPADAVLTNSGSLADLYAAVDGLALPR